MQLEDSNGKVVVPQSVAAVISMIDRLGKDLDHCILSEGDVFIQAAGSASSLLVEYGDSSGHYQASETLSPQTVKDLFTAFFQNDDSWKTKVAFSRVGGGEPFSSASERGEKDSTSEVREKSFKDSIIDSVTREVKHNISGMARRGVRNVFRKFK